MSENPFYRLAPFIQEYIYRQKWEELRAVQVEAITAILDTPNHVLISSATASGKTEAALLPIITQLYENPPSTIGVIYIGPLKALINDQFERITGLLEETEISVQSWHGDVSYSKKMKFLKQSKGILQITPESLEAMLINRHHELSRLFSDLRFVIIDEVHAFIDSDRGRQVICQLERLAKIQTSPARRIGLSATIGEPEKTMQWLAGNTGTPVKYIEDSKDGGKKEALLGLEHFLSPEEGEEENQPENTDIELNDLIVDSSVFYKHLYQMAQYEKKTLIFANQRSVTEGIIANLRQLSETKHTPNFYHVHHGSISAVLRETAEFAMREPEKPACVAATVTLELGIDIGQLDQVLQVNSTHSVSSFVQRLGRSGRRGDASRMFFYSTEEVKDAKHVGEQLPWDLLQSIAIIQLYIEEKWIEPPQIPALPLSLLYHQTMSTLAAHTELFPPQLAERMLSLSSFSKVTQEHYRIMLHHLIDIEHLELTDIGGLIIGLQAEKLVHNYHFYATFEDETGYQVRENARELGTISSSPEVGSTIGLAGYTWIVQDVNEEQKTVYVKRAKGKAKTMWSGGGVQIHTRILQKIHEILLSDAQYIYLHTRAKKRLEIARKNAHSCGLINSSILPIAPDRYLIFPWCGTRQFATQLLLFQNRNVSVKGSRFPHYYDIDTKGLAINDLIQEIIDNPPTNEEIAASIDAVSLIRSKYDKYVPEKLLREAFAVDFVDLEGAISSWKEILL